MAPLFWFFYNIPCSFRCHFSSDTFPSSRTRLWSSTGLSMNLLLLWRVFSSPLASESVLEPISKTTQEGCSSLKSRDEQGWTGIGSYVAVNWTNFHISPHCVITTGTRGLFCPSVGMFSIFLTISIPSSITWEKITLKNREIQAHFSENDVFIVEKIAFCASEEELAAVCILTRVS